MGVSAALLLTAVAAGAGGIGVDSAIDCPNADLLAARVRPFSSEAFADYRLSVGAGTRADTLALRLADAQGRRVAEREWPRAADCAAVADELAVVAATWLTNLPSLNRAEVDLPPGPAPSGASVPTVVVRSEAATPEAGRRFALAVAGGVMASSAAGVAPAAALGFSWTPAARRWLRVDVGVTVAGTWQEPLDTGQVDWQRWLASMGVGLQRAWGRLGALASVGVEAGFIRVRGTGLDDPRTVLKPQVGPFAAARLSAALWQSPGAPRLWLGLRAAVGLPRYEARVDGSEAKRSTGTVQLTPLLGVEIPLSR